MIKQLVAGQARSLALMRDGRAYVWGNVSRAESQLPPDDPLSALCGASPDHVGHHRYAQPVPQRLLPEGRLHHLCDATDAMWALDPQGQAFKLAASVSVVTGAPSRPVESLGGGLRQLQSHESAGFALDRNGRVWSWGHNFQGQLGRETATPLNQAPAVIGSLPPIVQLATGHNHTLALGRNGEVWAWGAHAAGQLGQGHLRACSVPKVVPIPARVTTVAAGETHSLAIDEQGRLWAWGSNHCGQLGPVVATSSPSYSARALLVRLPFRIRQLGAGAHYTVALSEQGEVFGWGWNGLGQLGQAVALSQSTAKPTAVVGLRQVEKINVGALHVLAYDQRGLCAWGDNRHAACGMPATQPVVSTPNFIPLA